MQSGVRCGKSGDNTFAAGEWFDCLPERVQERVREAGFGRFVDTLPQDLDATRQFNWGVATLSYLYYGMDLCVQGVHLKIGYKWAIERGLATIDHLAAFMSGAYMIFARTQLLIHVPPPTEFDLFVEVKELNWGQGAVLIQVSIDDHNEVCRLYKAGRLNLAEARLSDEHISVSINTIKKKTCNEYAMYACNAIINIYECVQRVDMVLLVD
ncbi:hypothetical protein JCGZ_10932 [Jatropha curcas]|uniref:Aminotransferase-like plant mobile domain-containing protein n=1 Tax=Jatropha curcas TaxID=180498 RepID=A0A067KT82_JATCU|nr:hypothetical protein JCGZ_10932 [Jatropha curcas]